MELVLIPDITNDRPSLAFPQMDGPRLERWNPRLLADALDAELARCAVEGWPKISLHMDIADAMKLAQYLRKV